MVITLLEGANLAEFFSSLGVTNPDPDVRSVRLCQQGDQIKVKVNGGMWTYGKGHLDPASDLAARRREIEAGKIRVLTDPT